MICPFCDSTSFQFFHNSSTQATAIYCNRCPCGLEDSTKTLDELKVFWRKRFHNKALHHDPNDRGESAVNTS